MIHLLIASTIACHSLNGLPDPKCTPGKVLTKDITKICKSGYTKTIRPPVSYTNRLKLKLMKLYGLSGTSKDYVVDHLISLELGGDPKDITNLWPENSTGMNNSHDKDKVENYLHKQVCTGKMKIEDAQKLISTQWTTTI